MSKFINILISMAVFIVALLIANGTGLDLVVKAVIIAFCMQWVAFIPAYALQTCLLYTSDGCPTKA